MSVTNSADSKQEFEPLPPWPRVYEEWADIPIIDRAADAQVGTLAFRYTNERVYRHIRGTGRAVGGPIERYRYKLIRIIGETRVSWITISWPGTGEHGTTKWKKKPERYSDKLHGCQDVEERLWHGANAYPVAELVKHVDYATLRKVADLIKYTGDKER